MQSLSRATKRGNRSLFFKAPLAKPCIGLQRERRDNAFPADGTPPTQNNKKDNVCYFNLKLEI